MLLSRINRDPPVVILQFITADGHDYTNLALPLPLPAIPCVVVGTVRDLGKTLDIRVCRERTRTALVYTSASHQIDVSFLDSEILDEESEFLIKYEGEEPITLFFSRCSWRPVFSFFLFLFGKRTRQHKFATCSKKKLLLDALSDHIVNDCWKIMFSGRQQKTFIGLKVKLLKDKFMQQSIIIWLKWINCFDTNVSALLWQATMRAINSSAKSHEHFKRPKNQSHWIMPEMDEICGHLGIYVGLATDVGSAGVPATRSC